MDVIPVIDLKGGLVVRARQGDRAAYRPIATPLSPTADPLDVVAGLLSLHPFRTLYAADLDAIGGEGSSSATLDRIAQEFPHLRLWIDNGCSDLASAEGMLQRRPSGSLVLGSESQRDTALVRTLRNHDRVILSLDFRGDAFLGPPELLAKPDIWPARLIVMTLARVGSGAGPDLERFGAIRTAAGGRAVYMAGGLRDARDLDAARANGAAGILVASALHDGRLSADDLAGRAASLSR